MVAVLGIAYIAWAIYAGHKVLTGRSEWLDRKAPANVIVKFILSAFVGGFIGGFYLIYFIFKLLVHS